MSVRTTALVGASVVVMAVGVNQALLPQDPVSQRQEQQVQDLSDSDDMQKDRHRDAGNSHLDAELRRETIPGEHRPPLPGIRIRIP